MTIASKTLKQTHRTNSTLTTIRAFHTPDPDDAYAWWAIATGRTRVPGCRIDVGSAHIQWINEQCRQGKVDIAAISSATYPLIANDYALLSAGASVGRGYGPALATRDLASSGDLDGALVAVPGDLTTGALLLRLFFPEARTVSLPFDQVAAAIAGGEVDAGVLIHEELLNWEHKGLRRLLCLGAEWTNRTGLPIPVGLNVVHRRHGAERIHQIAQAIRISMEEADRHPVQARRFAMGYSIEKCEGIGEKFMKMFANEDTIALGDDCLEAMNLLFRMAHERGLLPTPPRLEPIR